MMTNEDARPIGITLKNILKLGLIGVICFVMGWILCFMAALAWIAFRPLPHIPRFAVAYSITDKGDLDTDEPDPYQPPTFSVALSDDGRIVHFNDMDAKKRKAAHDAARKAFLKRDGFATQADIADYSEADDVTYARHGDALPGHSRGALCELPPPRRVAASFFNRVS